MQQRTPAEVVRLVKDESIEIVDLRFCDLPGMMQHFSAPAHKLTEEVFTEGFGFDGSSIRGFQQIHESDMILLPDPNTAYVDPFRQHKTLNINCFVHDPITREAYSRDPRYVAKKAEAYLKTTGIADTAYFGPEAEFFIFDDVRYGQGVNYAVLRGRLGRRALEHRATRRCPTWATSCGPRRGTSRCPRATTSRTCAPR